MTRSHLKNWLIVVPARLASERLPEKPLQVLGGKALIAQVFFNLRPLIAEGAEILVALDSESVAAECRKEGIPFVMTLASHKSGTDRCKEASDNTSRKFILNVQGDEPFVSLEDLKSLMQRMEHDEGKMGTMVFKDTDQQNFSDPNTVKVVLNAKREAIYFSRAGIPFPRASALNKKSGRFEFMKHVGVYAFAKEALDSFCRLPNSSLEDCEKLEQLRAIEAGWRILTIEATRHGIGIDTLEDLKRAEDYINSNNFTDR